ncbi:MAG: MmcQ/YjbR family DNA-binding protein [Actinomycetota bacterium]|nr:MmcQ/YjbR family DNA-binding protein [Actinomycetota bacterium]
MDRLAAVALALPEARRVDIEAWDDHPTFRVRGKNFVFSDERATHLSLKLSKDEAVAAVATETWVEPTGYGLGRHGWVSVTLDDPVSEDRWQQVEEWVRTSYTLVAPKRLAQVVLEADAATD